MTADKIKAILLLSGGLDSTTLCALAASQDREIHALSFDYGQRHRFELDSARRAAAHYGAAEHIVLPVNLAAFGGSSLTDPSMEVAHNVPLEKIGEKIPSSYVPARNTVFLSLALAYAETRKASEIWIGVNQVDYSGYPDCREEFLKAFENLARLATQVGVEGEILIQIKAPLLHLSKGEIVRLGLSLGVDYSQTMTCYSPTEDGAACGVCESCRLRLAGFKEAGAVDPARYVNRS